MIAGMRYRFLLSWLIFFAAFCWPVQAQINGVPASVTSLGFGGSANPTPGVRASVTSLGPNGYGNARPIFGDCCASFFLPANPNPPLFSGHHRGHHDNRDRGRNRDHNFFGVGVSEPVYVPYAVPYAEEVDQESSDVDSADVDSADDDSPNIDSQGSGPLRADSPRNRAWDRRSTVKTYPSGPEAPIAEQPSTVLVFKDGHRAEVLNYAVVGNTLFDFAADRTHKILLADLDLPATHKANDDRGVDFQIPAWTTGN